MKGQKGSLDEGEPVEAASWPIQFWIHGQMKNFNPDQIERENNKGSKLTKLIGEKPLESIHKGLPSMVSPLFLSHLCNFQPSLPAKDQAEKPPDKGRYF